MVTLEHSNIWLQDILVKNKRLRCTVGESGEIEHISNFLKSIIKCYHHLQNSLSPRNYKLHIFIPPGFGVAE